MIRVVMPWWWHSWGDRDDRGEQMNQDKVDQDVADELREKVDSRREVMRSEKND